MVSIVEVNGKRGDWPLGRITEVRSGADGLIRVVKVEVGKTIYKRPVVHRVLLRLMEEQSKRDETLLILCYHTQFSE